MTLWFVGTAFTMSQELKRWVLFVFGAVTLVAAGNARAQWDDGDNPSDWQNATLVSSDAEMGCWRCEYEATPNDERFVVNMCNGCSLSVEYNPFSGRVRD
ncbi:hypothetical protein [Paraburkholderia sp. J12]|uniref:hypothetical protein n=1 Tax=Paraburkholderia sp. J12 TaxID=2805432 RepID=UPI002ABE16BB|nr:hypothetical protein [Paraburkholderia sp. J12]